MPQPVTIANQGTGKYGAVNVTTAATLLTAGTNPTGGKQDMSSVGDRKNITIYNNGAANLCIGFDANVTTANAGIIVPAGQQFSADYGSKVTLYGICAAGTLDVRVAEVY